MEEPLTVADSKVVKTAPRHEPACWRISRRAVNKTGESTSAIFLTMLSGII
jgi:hypothetical protein